MLLAGGLLAGGSSYLSGVKQTTLTRVGGAESPLSVLADSWSWTGLVVILAVCAVVVSWAGRDGRARTGLLAVLAAAALLGPLEHARLHTVASLNKHVDLGAWFAVMAAGYLADRFIAAAPAGRMRAITCGACVVALTFPVALGASQSRKFSSNWPNATSFTAILRPLADRGSGHLLVEDPSIAEYYLPAGSQWQRWSSTRNIVLPAGRNTGGPAASAGVTGPGNAGVYAEFITAGYFSLVALNFADTTPLDHRIAADLRRNPHYHIIDVVPYGPARHLRYLAIRAAPVTVTRDGSQEPPVSAATVAAWRRRRNSWVLPSPPPDGRKPSNGLPASVGEFPVCPPDPMAHGFAESQQAGMAAMIGLAKADASLPHAPAVEPRALGPEPPAPRPSPAAATAQPRHVPVIDMPTPVIDQPLAPLHPTAPAAATRQSQEHATRNSSIWAYVPWLSLLVVLTVQAVISLRLVWSNTA